MAKVTLKREGDALTISTETNEKLPGRIKGSVNARYTRDGLKIFAPEQSELPGVLRPISGASTMRESSNE